MNVAIYARYSSDNQRYESIDAQVRAIGEYCKRNGYNVVKTYIDEAKSATTDNRPEFINMITESEKGLFKAVIVHKLDRFARNRYDSAYYKKRLKQSGVKLLSVMENLDDSPESIILESMLEGMAEYYSKNLSREVMKGMKETALQCKHTGGITPLGYDLDKEKNYIINDYEAQAVKSIFEMYASGKSYLDIVDWLNVNGYKTKIGNTFTKTSIYDLLRNEKYCGTYVFNKTFRTHGELGERNIKREDSEVIRIIDGIPAIVSKEVFEAVKSKLRINKKRSQSFRAKEVYLLSSKIYCGHCGGVMAGSRRNGGRDAKHLYIVYQCSARKNLKKCDKKEVDRDRIESLVLDYLEKRVFTDAYIEKIALAVYESYTESIESSNRAVTVLESRLKDIQKQIENIVTAIASGMFHESMKARMQALEFERHNTLTMITEERLKKEYGFTIDDIKKYLSIGKGIKEKDRVEQKKIIDAFVQKVLVYDNYFDLTLYVDTFGGGEPQYTISTSIEIKKAL